MFDLYTTLYCVPWFYSGDHSSLNPEVLLMVIALKPSNADVMNKIMDM